MPNACKKCGVEFQIGDWPFCPHGRSATSVVADDIPGGMVVENGFPEPIRVFSHSEHRRLLAARGLEIGAKWAGPHDKIMTRWDAPSAATLESAAILLSRKKSDPFAPPEAYEPIPIEVTTVTYERDDA